MSREVGRREERRAGEPRYSGPGGCGRTWEQDPATRAMPDRSRVQVPQGCCALSLFINLLLAAVWRREQRVQG